MTETVTKPEPQFGPHRLIRYWKTSKHISINKVTAANTTKLMETVHFLILVNEKLDVLV